MRGIHQRDAVTHLKDIIRQTDLQMLVILEPKAAHREISRFAFSIGFPYWLHGEEVNSHIGGLLEEWNTGGADVYFDAIYYGSFGFFE